MGLKRVLRLATALAAGALCGSAGAGEVAPAHAGVWAGTLGSSRVQVCLHGDDTSEYYYLRHKRGIRLEAPGHADNTTGIDRIAEALATGRIELEERSHAPGAPPSFTGRWTLQPDGSGGLSGTWIDPEQRTRLTIRLSRVPTPPGTKPRPDYAAYCHAGFFEPLRTGLRTGEREARFEGQAFREIGTDEATAFELPPGVPHATKLNAMAVEWLKDQAVFAYQCELGRGGARESLGRTLQPVFWSRHFLVLLDLLPDTYCGGAHNISSMAWQTWSLQRGQAVDTWRWIQRGAAAVSIERTAADEEIKGPLRQLLEREHPRNRKDDDCVESMGQMDIAAPFPTREALVFPTGFGHALRACADEVKLSWKQVAPFLTAEGRAARDLAVQPAR